MVHPLPYYQADSFSTNHRNTTNKNVHTPSTICKMINVTEVNKSSVFGPTNKIRGVNE